MFQLIPSLSKDPRQSVEYLKTMSTDNKGELQDYLTEAAVVKHTFEAQFNVDVISTLGFLNSLYSKSNSKLNKAQKDLLKKIKQQIAPLLQTIAKVRKNSIEIRTVIEGELSATFAGMVMREKKTKKLAGEKKFVKKYKSEAQAASQIPASDQVNGAYAIFR